METASCALTRIPPGFRFHPTEEELVGYYLRKKINQSQYTNVIIDIDVCTLEPWDIQVKCRQGAYEEAKEWYFFSHKGKKYPSGSRTNRATAAGFWKATGRDKAVVSKNQVIGMRKTLVFYQGRAPNGKKTDWIIHEFRLQPYEHGHPQEHGWVVCKAFRKPSPCFSRFVDQTNPHQLTFRTDNSPWMDQQELYPVELVPKIGGTDYALSANEYLITDWADVYPLKNVPFDVDV